VIEDVVETVVRCTGERPVGWLSPALTNTPRTLDLLPEYGFTYTCDLFHDDQPFPVRVRSGRLISMPYTLDLNDVVVFQTYLYSPDDYARMIVEGFDVLYAEGDRGARVMCVSLHPYLVGQAHRVRPLERALEHIVAHDDAWIATGREIADWYLREHYDEVAAAVLHSPRR
jgi:peptidoglycan/xylan/chitin deacetylase (PgdA/CDA1 family)